MSILFIAQLLKAQDPCQEKKMLASQGSQPVAVTHCEEEARCSNTDVSREHRGKPQQICDPPSQPLFLPFVPPLQHSCKVTQS